MAGPREQPMCARSAPYVIINRAGPTWDLAPLMELAHLLSQRYSGEIWTFSDSTEDVHVESFRIRRDRFSFTADPVRKALRVARLIGRGLVLRWFCRRRLIVITYDPLTAGVVGVGLRWLAGARFICEVNGAYDSVQNLVDLENVEAAAVKTRRAVRFASWVLRRAHHIKLLFPTQIRGFDVPLGIPRSVFLDSIDWSTFRYEETRPDPILVFVGFPFLLKGVDVLLKAFSRVHPDFPDWRLVLIGFRIPEEARARRLPLDGVTLLGPQPPAEVARWMERCRGLVLPSRTEAMGRVLIEAAVKGRARLASRVGGIPHYVEHDVDGLLFEPDDVDDLAATLRRFMNDETLQVRLGRAARARAEHEFSADAYLNGYSAVLDSV